MKSSSSLRALFSMRARAQCLLAGVLAGIAPCGCSKQASPAAGGDLPAPTREVLERYESVRAALASDDFGTARFAEERLAEQASRSAELPGASKEMMDRIAGSANAGAKAQTLDEAREAFKSVSAAAIAMAAGARGYHVINCPMTTDGNWLQTDTTISNPYFGKAMATCGVVKN